VDAGGGDAYADLTGTRQRIGHLAELEHLGGRALLLVPGCVHVGPYQVLENGGA
jgi:hypothetical protein